MEVCGKIKMMRNPQSRIYLTGDIVKGETFSKQSLKEHQAWSRQVCDRSEEEELKMGG